MPTFWLCPVQIQFILGFGTAARLKNRSCKRELEWMPAQGGHDGPGGHKGE